MARIPDAIAQNIQQFMIAVQKRQHVEAVYLYGSYVKGTATKWSDIDLVIVSPDFSEYKRVYMQLQLEYDKD